ncbi:venom acid phosphatase Acph-1 [Harpegnathos saltator]|uniref:acid phosphatase n=1 Tax=Harpegnathos saltator TaxID=610380 RepID=E2C1V8_HARSA|nr:venom acid phosphatase Acph-1 [Harpegnathos saltator]XP_011149157.1 venom acid phosphatase Acph-1 [Harpegnathos saltator]EFN78070.1 Testicular acid phosphatase-like protein [Harpegnathos saltator]
MILLRNFCSYLTIVTVIRLSAIPVEAVESELKLINVVFRHGDRTPDNNGFEMYPTDPYINNSFYPTGRGQLTLAGKRREYKLGQNLRNRYSDYLGSVYLPGHVVARSSDYDRTKMSLQLVLAGLYPPADVQRWNKWLNWQPIPALYTPRVDDKLLLSDECPEYLNEYERVLRTPEVQAIMDQFKDMKHNLTKQTGKSFERIQDYFFLYQTFIAESSLGLPLPEWAYNYFPNSQLFDATVASYDISNENDILKKYFAGPLIRAMTDNMIAAQNDASLTKVYLYSGHESNIAALLHALRVYEPHVPEYSSAIFIELQKINSEFYVKIIYYLGIPPDIKELTLPGCELLCPFDKFLDLMEHIMPTDEELVCDKRKTPSYANVPYPAAVQQLVYELLKSSTSKNRNRL